ncbi:hypothetical protein AB2L57_09580 [Microbacterium sp. HA-8]|uniref:hypothetical protein n=1 Tax=Microbacterium sp. HA-8 TaxID=3234200 RepID=UPI0038F692C9
MATDNVAVTLEFPGVSAEALRNAALGVFAEDVFTGQPGWHPPIESAWRSIESIFSLPHEKDYPVLNLEAGGKNTREPYQAGSYLIRIFETDAGTRLWVDYRSFSDAWGREKKLKKMREVFPTLIDAALRKRL